MIETTFGVVQPLHDNHRIEPHCGAGAQVGKVAALHQLVDQALRNTQKFRKLGNSQQPAFLFENCFVHGAPPAAF
jgi:hypothetical protein